jgi:DNA-binding Xre family transcriptional regulator
MSRAMVVRRLDNAKLARLADVSEGTIGNVRTGKRVRIEVIDRIAEALESTPADPVLLRFFRGDYE